MEVFSYMTEAQEAYEEYYTQAVNFVRDKIESHFCDGSYSYTNEQLETLYGKTIYSSEGVDNETYEEYSKSDSGMLDINKALDRVNIQEALDSYEDLSALITLAKELGVDITGLDEPYKIIVLRDTEDLYVEDWETAEELLVNENNINDNLDKIIVCQNYEDLLKAWEIYLEQYEGCWYGVKSDDYGIIVGGAYDPNDIEVLEEDLVSYKKVQEPVKETNKDKQLEEAWEALEDIPLDYNDEHPDGYYTEALSLPNQIDFPAGTDKEDVWLYFDENHSKGVAYLLYGHDPNKENKAKPDTKYSRED